MNKEFAAHVLKQTFLNADGHLPNANDYNADDIVAALRMAVNMFESKNLISEDLDSFAIKYAQDKPYPVTVCQAVKVGANWQEEQLLAKAVDGTFSTGELADGTPIDAIFNFDKVVRNKYEEGEKVKILVIKRVEYE